MIGSPTAYLLWSILASTFLICLIIHLWRYDRFRCLLWRGGSQRGPFRRIMTYSYLGTVFLLLTFSVAITVMKFQEGFFAMPGGILVPKPFALWNSQHQRWLLPLCFILSAAWGLELVTHFEELAFWLFLLNQGPKKRDWFHSWEYRMWCIGSIVATAGMPLTVLITRRHIENCITWIFLVGALAGTLTTLSFLYVLARFPSFLLHVKSEGAEQAIVVRLMTFCLMNRVRVVFRFIFTVPLLVLACDGISAPYQILNNAFAVDFLVMISGIGCFTSSAITLLIFFPPSIDIAQKAGYKPKVGSSQVSNLKMPTSSAPPNYYSDSYQKIFMRHTPETRTNSFHFPETFDPASFRPSHHTPIRRSNSAESDMSPGYESDVESDEMASYSISTEIPTSTSMLPSRNTTWDRELGPALFLRRRHSDSYFHERHWKFPTYITAWSREEARDYPPTSLHPFVLNFTSPIDLVDGYGEFSN